MECYRLFDNAKKKQLINYKMYQKQSKIFEKYANNFALVLQF